MKTLFLIVPLFTLTLSSCDREKPKDPMSDLKESPAKMKIKGNWNEAKGRLKQQFGNLTDDDLLYAEGKEDELYGRLQKKLGKSKEEIQKIINGD